MKLGKMLSFLSPALGMATGNGLGFLPYLSPGIGMLSGKGPFALGGHGDKDEQQQPQAAQMPAAMGMQAPMPMQQPMQAPPTGMFGAPSPGLGQMDPQDMLRRYLMMQQGGGY